MQPAEPSPDRPLAYFWHGLEQGRFLLQQCNGCSKFFFYPRVLCPHCGHPEWDWREASGEGVIYSYTGVYKTSKGPEPDYIVALIDLAEGPRMMAQLINCTESSIAVGDRVRAVITAHDEGKRVDFEPVEKGKRP